MFIILNHQDGDAGSQVELVDVFHEKGSSVVIGIEMKFHLSGEL